MGGPEGRIEWLCYADGIENIPEPLPAQKCLPEWYKEMPFSLDDTDAGDYDGLTVRSCMAVLDAMTMGWILRAPFDIDLTITRSNGGFDIDIDRSGIPEWPNQLAKHPIEQLGGSHPEMPLPILKFITPWVCRAPEGVSSLITSPFNQHDRRFEAFSGVVDHDHYFGLNNVPSLWTELPYNGVIEQGTPLAQVIPFTRDGIVTEATVREMDADERRKRDEQAEQLIPDESHYRQEKWVPKGGARNDTP